MPVIFSDLSVIKREYGNSLSLRTGLAGTIFKPAQSMIRKIGYRFSEKIMLQIEQLERDDY
jgi:hypothetical protein